MTIFTDQAEIDQVSGNRTRKPVQRNVRSKRSVTSPREGPTQGSVEPIKPEQKLVPSGNTSSPRLTSPSTGTADIHSKETSSKNTDTATVVVYNDHKTEPSNIDSNSAAVADKSEDTNIDLDEQAIMTYVLTMQHFGYAEFYVKLSIGHNVFPWQHMV